VRLIGRSGTGFELLPLRYQFAGVSGDEWDDNWLVVRGRVVTESARWTFVDPALLVDEAEDLRDWLVRASRRLETPFAEPTARFIEPNLAFGITAYGDDTATVLICLAAEALPQHQAPGRTDDVVSLELVVSLAHLADAAREWSEETTRFPRR